jgi:hypothetical protein
MPFAPSAAWLIAGLILLGDARQLFAQAHTDSDEPGSQLSFLDRPAGLLSGLPQEVAATLGLTELAVGNHEPDAAPSIAADTSSCEHGWWTERQAELLDDVHRMCLDFKHMYTGRHLGCLGLTIAAAYPLANTHADQGIRDWYQREVRSRHTEEWAEVANHLGEWQIVVPIFMGAWFIGDYFEDRPCLGAVGEWGGRTMRALAVGAPASGLLQVGLGASRPEEGRSHWHPFQDNNSVAGHGFVGAVPFLSAASMTRHRPLKALLFAGSFCTTWARLDSDAHYFSQCLLGWSIAYLATQSVNDTELHMRRVLLTPMEMPQGGTGLGVLIRY